MILKIILVAVLSFSNPAFGFDLEMDSSEELDWWQNTVFYQVYPRSFKDSNGDGIGDLKGIETKAEYFKWLGVGTIWLNPIFKSPMVDFGYDISDYRMIYDKFGTVDDLKSLTKKLKQLGIKLILDFVPNHTSDEIDWFQKSVDKIEPYTDYYIWKDPKGWDIEGNPVPPNNWISAFNIVPAWTYNEKRKQFYLHHFHRKQPDLNYRNEKVIEEMEDILIFWLDAGVDGFRVDAVPYLVEHIDFPDEEVIDPVNVPENEYDNLNHTYTKDQPETFQILRRWRKLCDHYAKEHKTETKLFMTEAYTNLENTMKYYGTNDEPIAHIPFNFELIIKLNAHSRSYEYAKVINDWFDNMPQGRWANWVVGNHDINRMATKFGSEMVDVLNMMVNLLPGTAINYYGDELGMSNAIVRWDQTVDPQGLVLGPRKYTSGSRDGARSPMQWDNSKNAGFSTANKTWLPVNTNYWNVNLEKQKREVNSHVNIYRKLVAARQFPAVQKGDFNISTPDEWTIVFTRTYEDQPSFIVIMNIGSEPNHPDLSSVPGLPKEAIVYVGSRNCLHKPGYIITLLAPHAFEMRPKSSLVLTTDMVIVKYIEDHLGFNELINDM